jgi:site-specific DNA-methyltransferase (adenine-specific)
LKQHDKNSNQIIYGTLRSEKTETMKTPVSIVTNECCMDLMSRYPDKYFELAIVDPPYGLEWSGTGFKKKNIQERNLEKVKDWETKAPTQEYFDELIRVSKDQIIWGGNYFLNHLGFCKVPLIWDKQTGDNTFADGELAWTSFKTGTLRIFRHQWCGAFKDSERGIKADHPTQKPIMLYKWCLDRFSKKGDKILDTHLGSGSSRIAAYIMGFDFYGSEIDKDYFDAQEKRFREQTAQGSLFKYDKAS